MLTTLISQSTWAAKNVCPIPDPKSNISVINIACDYSKSIVELKPEQTAKNLVGSLTPLYGIGNDLLYFNYLAKNLKVEAINICEGPYVTKSGMLAKLQKAMSNNPQYVALNISGHGQYHPEFKNGKFVGLKWSLLIPKQITSIECSDQMTGIDDLVKEHGLQKAEAMFRKDSTLLKKAKTLDSKCNDGFLKFDEISEHLKGRATVLVADTCYAGGICTKSAGATGMAAVMSSTKDKPSYEVRQISKPEIDQFTASIDPHNADETKAKEEIKNFYNLWLSTKTVQQVPNTGEQFEKDFNAIKEQLLTKNATKSEVLDTRIAELKAANKPFDEATVQNAFKTFINHQNRVTKDWKKVDNSDRRAMGGLTSLLYDRDLAKLDINNDKKVTFKEYFKDLDTGKSENGIPPNFYGSGCPGAWLNYPVFDLQNPIAKPEELKSFEYGSEKFISPDIHQED